MPDRVFSVEETASQQAEDTNAFKSEALVEIARSPVMKKYFKSLIEGYSKFIVEASKPLKIDENKVLLLELHAKKESLEKMLAAAEDEVRNTP